MTVSTTSTRDQYTGTGADTALATTFAFNESSEVVVTSRVTATGVDTVLIETTHYTVTGGSWSTGTVTPVDGAADFPTTVTWTLERQTPLTQSTDWVENDEFPAESHERAADKLTFITQEREDRLDRALVAPATDDTALDMELPNSVDRASLFLAFDADGEPIASSGVTPATVTVSDWGETLVDDVDAETGRATILAGVIDTQGDLLVGDSDPKAATLAIGAANTILSSDGTDPSWQLPAALSFPLPRSYLVGLTLSNDTDTDHDIAIAVGECRDSTNAVNINVTAALGKMLDATWTVGGVPGTTVGGLNATDYAAGTNGPEASTRYHVFLIMHTDGTVDAGFDKDDSATNLLSDSGYTYYRRIGSIWTDASENFLAFTQHGDTFLLTTPPSVQDTGVAAAGETMAIPVAPNSWVTANLRLSGGGVGTWHCYIYATEQTSQAPSTTVAPLYTVLEDDIGLNAQLFADADSEIGIRSDDDGVDLLVVVIAYIDRRGRDD